MKSVVFIECNFTGIDAIVSASKAGIKCYLITSDLDLLKSMLPKTFFDHLHESVDIIKVQNSDNVEEVLSTIDQLNLKPSAVLTFSQFRLVTASHVASRLNLKCTNVTALENAIDKYALREVMRASGLPSIKYLSLTADTNENSILTQVGLPCIFKPSKGHSSLNIELVRSISELRTALLKYQLKENFQIIVEEYLEGPLFSLETITCKAGDHITWGYTDRVLTENFIEIGATFPSQTPNDKAGVELVQKTLDAIGFDFGACHTEMIFTKNGPRIVEVNPRPGGSGVCRLISLATEHDVTMEIVNMYLGAQPSQNLKHYRSVTMNCLLPHQSGRIVALPNKTQLLKLKGVRDVWFQREEGESTNESRSNFSYTLTIMTVAEEQSSYENAKQAASLASSMTLIEPHYSQVLNIS